MYTNRTLRFLAVLLAIASLGAVQLGCSLFGGQTSAPLPQQDQPEIEIENPDDRQQTLPGEASSDNQGQAPVEPQFGQETLPCPAKGAILSLGFDHALTVNYQDVSLSHFLHQGWINLKVADEQGTIVPSGSATLTYSMEGRMSARCALTGQGSMAPTAHGSCEAGVVSLIIEENWLPLTGEMTCVDDDGDTTTVPFDAPAMGLQTHSGADGNGEIFYLVEGSQGYSSMRPFAEGEGYHTWTLYVDEIPVVPLAPER